MAIYLPLNFCNSWPSPFSRPVKACQQLKNFINSTVSLENVVDSTRLNNIRKGFVKIPQRASLSTIDFSLSAYATELEVSIRKSDDFAEMDSPDSTVQEQCCDDLPFLCLPARDIMDKRYAIDILSCCRRKGWLELAKGCHGLVLKNGAIYDKFVVTSLLNMYASCGEIDNALAVFDQMIHPDVASCNCLIAGYANNEFFHKAFGFFINIGSMGITPNQFTFSILLSMCGTLLAFEEGIQLHAQVVKWQFLSETGVANALLTMYINCGKMDKAESLFQRIGERNLISWTAIISGLRQHKDFEKALRKFCLMRESGIEPNEYTFTTALACCGSMKHFDNGCALHAQVVKNGMVSGVFVGTAVVGMYTELGDMQGAEIQFREMRRMASIVSWNALIAGFVRNANSEAAMEAFYNVVNDDTACDEFTYSIILKACSSFPSMSSCKQIHARIIKGKFVTNLHVGSSLIEAYSKCGNLEDAKQVFYQISSPDVITWNSIIKAYSQFGYPRKAINLFRKMVGGGKKPTTTTFLAILSACSHSGLVQEGEEFFESMVRNYSIPPEETHYSCMVDLLGRSGQLEKALEFINNLPIKPTASIWRPLLAACRCHGNVKLAEFVAQRILDLEPEDITVYVTLSNMYAEAGRHDDAERQRELMEHEQVSKEPGCSWMEIDNKIYKFFSGGKHTLKCQEYMRN